MPLLRLVDYLEQPGRATRERRLLGVQVRTLSVRHEALLFRTEVEDHPSPRRRIGEVKLEAA
ncbi:hypothetical protein [Streptomyces sp. NPDC056682]|uniref:hypothetical protein n=1 Tax=Streptomyces sp. NPDC056682 TaxID=3345909 RepID=UPI003695D180